MSFSPRDIENNADMLDRLRLIRTDGIGPIKYFRHIEKQGNAAAAISYLESAFEHFGNGPNPANLAIVKTELSLATELGLTYLFHGKTGYPEQLASIPDAPPVLTCIGNLDLLYRRSIAVVGARNCSAGGIKFTRTICKDLAESGLVIVSGLARGIDAAAHEASVSKGTIACVAGGIDVIYPQENTLLYKDIAERGLLISEMAPGTKPQARHFPRRNRIISGLCTGLLVIEATFKSGSLITARFAADQGRDVFAVPGSPLDPRTKGTNQLIKDGAVLTQCAGDITQELDAMPLLRQQVTFANQKPKVRVDQKMPVQHAKPSVEPQAARPVSDILDLLSPDPTHIDELVRLSGRSAEELLVEFTELEIMGDILRHAGGKYSRL
ncbi:MAG: DNA-protecting protein DprA [Kordiimonadales bacterium]|nr:MAG: DNA-protecting protein DprA [Kordiimonadales bacterium]